MNPDLDKLQPYPFEKLAALKAGISPALQQAHIALSIGEPRHAAPGFVAEILANSFDRLSNYPLTRGMPELRQAIARWLQQRFKLATDSLDPERQILPVNGTREALFAFAQTAVDRTVPNPLVLMPNPFYQIYEGAALLAGAQPFFLNCSESNGLLPDFDAVDEETWSRCQLLYLCSPGNPTGAVIGIPTLQKLITLAQEYNFIIAADECYSELYFDEQTPPPGLLQAAHEAGNTDFNRCVVFHSLSKRSNLPGLRSGFVAGDAELLAQFFKYRTYHGCAMPLTHQIASAAVWADETHVRENRRLYREKFDAVLDILEPVIAVSRPDASFYLWPQTPIDDTEFARGLFSQQNVTVLPGSYLSRSTAQGNPGAGHIRIALVAKTVECVEAARRIRRYIESL
ncbi:N-succinyl-L,L-diaminopimelate aminotransferase, type 2 [hydrothermal vent metagenome]|uniref:N-succinyl-L,L-diaminopimelate aminotransferase, type 2 n=1 Tax=hydrothermal vent metagenome TaxID=652676 RepID=A0A3B1C1K8_9ZZZZ